MNNLLAVLKAGTAVVPPLKQDIGSDQRGIADLMQLAAKLSRQPQADPQTPRAVDVRISPEKPQAVPDSFGKQSLADLRIERLQELTKMLGAVEARLTPVQKGELARLRDASPTDKSSSGPVTPFKSLLALTQDRLTPVQQGELAREIANLRLSRDATGLDSPVAKLSFGGIFGDIIDGIKDLGGDIVDGAENVIDNIGDIIKSLKGVGNSIQSTVEGAYKDIKEDLPGIAEAVGSTLKKDFGVGDGWDDHLREILKNPNAYAGYQLGVVKGVGEGIVDLAKSAGTVVQTAADFGLIPIPGAQVLPRLGDLFRDWDKTGALPDFLDEALPSGDRGRETVTNALNGVKAVGEYIISRGKNPELVIDDVYNVIKGKWDSLKGEWEKAHKAGAKQEGEFFGKIVGRALFEVAAEFVPGKAVFSVLRVVDKVTDYANLVKKLPDGNTLHSGNLTNFGKSIDKLEAEADKIIKIKNGDDVTDDQLKSLQDNYATLNSIDHNKLGFSSEAETISNNIAETKHKVEEAVNTIYRLSLPEAAARRKRKRDEWNATWAARMEEVKYAPGYTDTNFTPLQNKLRNIAKNKILKLTPGQSVTFDDLHRVTQDRGHEYSIFEVTNADGTKQQYIARGDKYSIEFTNGSINRLKNLNAKLVAHSHVGNQTADLEPSDDDIALLNEFGGLKSYIVNGRGTVAEFRADGTFTKVKNYNDRDSFNSAANNAEKNTIYEYNRGGGLTFTYKTNDDALIDTVQFAVTTNNPGKRNGLQTTIGYEGAEGDVGFHLHGVALGGETNRLTVVPGNGLLNSTNNSYETFGNWETNLLNRKNNNPNLQLEARIQVKYDETLEKGDDFFNRPTEFIASYREKNASGAWGPWQTTTFENEAPAPKT
jgi:hypothetical protein